MKFLSNKMMHGIILSVVFVGLLDAMKKDESQLSKYKVKRKTKTEFTLWETESNFKDLIDGKLDESYVAVKSNVLEAFKEAISPFIIVEDDVAGDDSDCKKNPVTIVKSMKAESDIPGLWRSMSVATMHLPDGQTQHFFDVSRIEWLIAQRIAAVELASKDLLEKQKSESEEIIEAYREEILRCNEAYKELEQEKAEAIAVVRNSTPFLVNSINENNAKIQKTTAKMARLTNIRTQFGNNIPNQQPPPHVCKTSYKAMVGFVGAGLGIGIIFTGVLLPMLKKRYLGY
jgi:hypothetical protein